MLGKLRAESLMDQTFALWFWKMGTLNVGNNFCKMKVVQVDIELRKSFMAKRLAHTKWMWKSHIVFIP
jgi:hypothetical protein